MMNKKILGISFLFFVFVLLSANVSAGIMDGLTGNNQSGTLYSSTGSNQMWGSLASAGAIAGSYVGGSYLTKMIAGGNKAAESSADYGAGIGTLGSTLGGLIFGSAGGAIGGALGGLLGDTIGVLVFAAKDKEIGKLDRGIISRVIGYYPSGNEDNNGAVFYDAKYKIAGNDTPSDKFNANLKADKNFVKKGKDGYLQYTPVEISVKNKNLVDPIQVAVLNVSTKGLPEYINAKEGKVNSTFAQYQTYQPNNETTLGNQQDPYADALQLEVGSEGDMGWCKVDDKGALEKKDREISKKYIQDLAEKELKDGTETFVLLMKYMNAQEETINIPNFNCFGPNGLTGVTGPEFKPKVLFQWGYDVSKAYDWCSKDINDNSRIYCDSTQFMEQLYSRLLRSTSLMNNFKTNVTTSEDFNKELPQYDAYYDKLHFRAHLMLDGYTKDFLSDFNYYILNTQFLNINGDDAKLISQLTSKLEFRPLSGETVNPEGYRLPQAGYYNVNIIITYKQNTKQYGLYQTSGILNPNIEKIIVFFEPISRESNPVYYMPLDATVGVVNGVIDRVGYGVDYSSETGSAVWFSRNQRENILLEPTLRSNSSPIVHLNMKTYEDTLSLNGNMRGTLLQIIPKSSSLGVSYDVKRFLSLPAFAKLDIQKTSQGGAYAYYTVDYGNGPENAGSSFVLWNLFCGYNDDGTMKGDCSSFSGAKPTDDMYLPDKLGTFAKVAPTGQLQGKVYGLEWDKDTRVQGVSNVSYIGLVYLPESTKQGNMNIVLASDSANITRSLAPAQGEVADIQAIYNLMDDNLICMTSDSAGVKFWWNPEVVFKKSVLNSFIKDLVN